MWLKAAILPPSVTAGGVATLLLKICLAPGFRLFAEVPADQDYLQTSIGLEASDGVSFIQAMEKSVPMPYAYLAPGVFVYEDDLAFAQLLCINPDCSGQQQVKVTVGYQVCEGSICFAPQEEALSVSIGVTQGTAEE